jgi:hypothetical protein
MERYAAKYKEGDIVLTGDALGYQGTFLMTGNMNKFPEILSKYIRNICYIGKLEEENLFRVEFDMIDEPHLFDENYKHFFEQIDPILHDYGFKRIKD